MISYIHCIERVDHLCVYTCVSLPVPFSRKAISYQPHWNDIIPYASSNKPLMLTSVCILHSWHLQSLSPVWTLLYPLILEQFSKQVTLMWFLTVLWHPTNNTLHYSDNVLTLARLPMYKLIFWQTTWIFQVLAQKGKWKNQCCPPFFMWKINR